MKNEEKKYTAPQLEIINFENSDIITNSNLGHTDVEDTQGY